MKIGIGMCICLWLIFWLIIHQTLVGASASAEQSEITNIGESDSELFAISDETLIELSDRLSPMGCGLVSSYLVQHSSNPNVAGTEVLKIIKQSENLGCYEALKYWNDKLVPNSKPEGQGPAQNEYGLRTLTRALEFAGREDLKGWILSRSGLLYDAEWQNNNDNNNGEDSEIDTDTRAHFGTINEKEFFTDDAIYQFFLMTDAPKTPRNSEIDRTEVILTYAAAIFICTLIFSLVIVAVILCLRPQRPYRNNRVGVADMGEQEEDSSLGEGLSGTIIGPGQEASKTKLGSSVKLSILKESSEPQTGNDCINANTQAEETGSIAVVSGENENEVSGQDQNANANA